MDNLIHIKSKKIINFLIEKHLSNQHSKNFAFFKI